MLETEFTYAFLDIGPLNKGHCLVIPKHHGQFLHEIPDESLQDLLPVAKRIVNALGTPKNYNILQNNGALAHQAVNHVHFHIIPKDENGGLGIEWNSKSFTNEEYANLAKQIAEKL